jgi:hypothetical protein
MKQQVVARWMDVPFGRLQDERDGPLDDPGGVALVVPEGLGIQAVEPQSQGQEENKPQNQVAERRPAHCATSSVRPEKSPRMGSAGKSNRSLASSPSVREVKEAATATQNPERRTALPEPYRSGSGSGCG